MALDTKSTGGLALSLSLQGSLRVKLYPNKVFKSSDSIQKKKTLTCILSQYQIQEKHQLLAWELPSDGAQGFRPMCTGQGQGGRTERVVRERKKGQSHTSFSRHTSGARDFPMLLGRGCRKSHGKERKPRAAAGLASNSTELHHGRQWEVTSSPPARWNPGDHRKGGHDKACTVNWGANLIRCLQFFFLFWFTAGMLLLKNFNFSCPHQIASNSPRWSCNTYVWSWGTETESGAEPRNECQAC